MVNLVQGVTRFSKSQSRNCYYRTRNQHKLGNIRKCISRKYNFASSTGQKTIGLPKRNLTLADHNCDKLPHSGILWHNDLAVCSSCRDCSGWNGPDNDCYSRENNRHHKTLHIPRTKNLQTSYDVIPPILQNRDFRNSMIEAE